MGFLNPKAAQPAPLAPPVPLPPAAHAPVLGSSQTVQIGASKAGAAAIGLGFDQTLATGPKGLEAPATNKSTLLG